MKMKDINSNLQTSQLQKLFLLLVTELLNRRKHEFAQTKVHLDQHRIKGATHKIYKMWPKLLETHKLLILPQQYHFPTINWY